MEAPHPAARLIVALDVEGLGEARRLVKLLSPHVGWFKVGSVLFTRDGRAASRMIKDAGARLFIDLKFHDIPNTVFGAVKSVLDLDADMVTLHVAGGKKMLAAAVRARDETGRMGALLVGVTVLTHLSFDDFRALFASDRSSQETAAAMAALAREAGLDGVVASAHEAPAIKAQAGAGFLVVTPGIRLDEAADDQARVVTPRQAVRSGTDYLVVGRPVIAAPDPVGACRRILEDMSS